MGEYKKLSTAPTTAEIAVYQLSGTGTGEAYLGSDTTGTLLGSTCALNTPVIATIPINSSIYVYASGYSNGIIPVVSGDVSLVSYSSTDTVSDLFLITGNGSIGVSIRCLIKGTLITLADFSQKLIEEITYNDNILVWDFYTGTFSSAKPAWIFNKQTQITPQYELIKFSDGSEIGSVGPYGHRIYNNEMGKFTYTQLSDSPDGTHTLNIHQEQPYIISREIIYKPTEYYNFGTDGFENCFANGILTGSSSIAIKDMKYDLSNQLLSDEYIEMKKQWHLIRAGLINEDTIRN